MPALVDVIIYYLNTYNFKYIPLDIFPCSTLKPNQSECKTVIPIKSKLTLNWHDTWFLLNIELSLAT